MQNPLLDSKSELFVRSFHHDHEEAITLIGRDMHKDDFIETPYSGGHPDNVRYHTRSIVQHSFEVTGFVFNHSHGTTIIGEFAQPIVGFERTLEMDGEEIDGNSYEDKLEKAIVAKLGRISGLREVNLI